MSRKETAHSREEKHAHRMLWFYFLFLFCKTQGYPIRFHFTVRVEIVLHWNNKIPWSLIQKHVWINTDPKSFRDGSSYFVYVRSPKDVKKVKKSIIYLWCWMNHEVVLDHETPTFLEIYNQSSYLYIYHLIKEFFSRLWINFEKNML